jgi:hypothetical protein
MRVLISLLVVCAWSAYAGQDPEDAVVAQARAGIEKLRALVEAGAAPRAQLEKAEEGLADAEDAAILRHTVYGQDLTEDQTGGMLAAAERRLERRKKALAVAQGLVREGVASPLSLGTFLEALDLARKEYDLAGSRARLCHELTQMAQRETDLENALERSPAEALIVGDRFEGGGAFTQSDFVLIENAYLDHFGKALPVSAVGETAVHRAMGFDHRGRVDVAVHPDKPEGVWLREYLSRRNIPFLAFRQAVPGKATGAHIHIGPMSTRLAKGG